eukprot:1037898_1
MSLLNLILLVSLFSRNVVRSQDCPEGQFLCMEGGEGYCRATACDYSDYDDDNDQGGDNDGPSDVNDPSGGYDDVNDGPSDVNDGPSDVNDGPSDVNDGPS